MSDHSIEETKPTDVDMDQSSNSWTDELDAQVQGLINEHVTFSEVLRHFPDFPWEVIADKVLTKSKSSENWKRKVACYRYLIHDDSSFRNPSYKTILSGLEKYKDLRKKGWNDTELEQLQCLVLDDLTRDTVSAKLPGKTLDQVRKAIWSLTGHGFYTPKELEIIGSGQYSKEELEEILFMRTRNSISSKLVRVANANKTKTSVVNKVSKPVQKPSKKQPLKEFSSDDLSKLESLSKTKLVFSEIISEFPKHDRKNLASELVRFDSEDQAKIWVKKICCYYFLYSKSKSVEQGLRDLGFYKKSVQRSSHYLRQIMTNDGVKGWSKNQIEIFHALSLDDLTRDSLTKHLPSKNIDTIKEIFHTLGGTIYFTKGEIEYLTKHENAPLETLMENLPIRNDTSIRRKQREMQPDNDTTKKVEQEEVQNEEEDDETDGIIAECIEYDLTLSNIQETFPDEPIETILEQIRNHPSYNKDSFTSGEKTLLTDLVKQHKSVDECIEHFPLRDHDFISRKYNEIEYIVGERKVRFNSEAERLAYEAKWTVVLSSGRESSRAKRASKRAADLEDLDKIQQDASVKRVKVKVELTEEELRLRKERAEERKLLLERKKEERKKLRELEKIRHEERQKLKEAGLIPEKPQKDQLYDLFASADYFQTIVGNRQKVEEGAKRQRVQTEVFVPEFSEKKKKVALKTTSRHARKKEIQKELKREKKKKKVIQKKGSKNKKQHHEPTDEEIIAEIKKAYKLTSDQDFDQYGNEEDEEEEEEFISPFDPPDIISDAQVNLNNRHLYHSSIYDETPSIPKLNFISIDQGEVSNDVKMSPGKQIMTRLDDKILYEDNLAFDLVTTHIKSYRDMPISFPPILDPFSKEVNPLNIIRIRFLLYPEHSESFILAAPKSNELDPVQEINKLFMIQYALYFSHSEVLKQIITEDYCQKLEHAVEENDFGEFMSVIDKWNTLVLKLTPNVESATKIINSGEDINSIPRHYLNEQEVGPVTTSDLKLDTFYEEISYESVSPAYQPVEIKFGECSDIPPPPSHNIDEPTNLSQESKSIKPENYNTDFFKRLQQKTTVSRFAMQQILLRVYSRVVSTDSRKLRSYKAFTAEVYGELLPSFTSEVLEKVNLLPTQKFYDLGSGVGNTTFQAALEFGANVSGGCELMDHASHLTTLQSGLIQKHLAVLGLKSLSLDFALHESFVDNAKVQKSCLDSDVLIINNYLFDGQLNVEVGKLLYGLRPGTKIISLRNFISPRYRATFDTVFDYLRVEKHEMSDIMSVSWTANKVPYYISTVEDTILKEYLGKEESGDLSERSKSASPIHDFRNGSRGAMMTPPTDSSSSCSSSEVDSLK
ncbi:DOT1 Histone-lysine N-methyltransferase [Candida maltosa Xu316]